MSICCFGWTVSWLVGRIVCLSYFPRRGGLLLSEHLLSYYFRLYNGNRLSIYHIQCPQFFFNINMSFFSSHPSLRPPLPPPPPPPPSPIDAKTLPPSLTYICRGPFYAGFCSQKVCLRQYMVIPFYSLYFRRRRIYNVGLCSQENSLLSTHN